MTDAPAKAGERGKPILFSAPMVKALLAGTKTQTRRIITPRGNAPSLFDGTWSDSYVLDPGNASWRERDVRIQPGDRLWVREAWRTFVSLDDTAPRDLFEPGERGGQGRRVRWTPGMSASFLPPSRN